MNKSGVIRSSGVVSAFTMLSRALGLVRDILMAAAFGTSPAMSAFVLAFRIPNLFRRLFGEGALSASFVPVFSETLEKEGRPQAWALARRVMTMLGVVLLAVTAAGILLAAATLEWLPALRAALARRFPDAAVDVHALADQAQRMLPLFQILFPYMLFVCLVALCMGILNSFRHFALPAATPVILNAVWIVALLATSPLFGAGREARIRGVAWGVLAAGAIQLAAQFPALVRRGYRPGLSFAWRDPRVKRVLLLMGPAALGMGLSQVNIMIDSTLAFFIADWAPAALFYAERLIYFPLGIFATALGTVLLPVLSQQAARADPDAIKATLNHSLRHLLFVMVPASVGLLVMAGPIVRMIFEWQDFDAHSSTLTTVALCFYAPGLVAFSVNKVFVPAFYSLQDTRTPVRVGVRMVGLNLALNLLFVLTWPLELKHAGLAFATVLSSAVGALILGRLFQKRLGSPGWHAILRSLARIVLAALGMALVTAGAYALLCRATAGLTSQKTGQVLAVGGSIAAGAVAYVLAACLLRCEEARDIWRALHTRRSKPRNAASP
ncbi:MAG: murein biosynthesis integral membrane protein MurJ [Kiritimatiellae bacterium]|nr:murein biosynthesis integral membrane protein MurJ [Kiritimatiellia bacterium]